LDTEEQFRHFSHGLNMCYSNAESRGDLPRAVLLTIAADRERVEELAREAGGEVHIAMDNCPHQVVVVAERDAAERMRELAQRDGLILGELPYDRAVHTPLFVKLAEDLRRRVMPTVQIGSASTPLYSCTTESLYPPDEAGARELLVEHWTRPVEFRRTIEKLYAD